MLFRHLSTPRDTIICAAAEEPGLFFFFPGPAKNDVLLVDQHRVGLKKAKFADRGGDLSRLRRVSGARFGVGGSARAPAHEFNDRLVIFLINRHTVASRLAC